MTLWRVARRRFLRSLLEGGAALPLLGSAALMPSRSFALLFLGARARLGVPPRGRRDDRATLSTSPAPLNSLRARAPDAALARAAEVNRSGLMRPCSPSVREHQLRRARPVIPPWCHGTQGTEGRRRHSRWATKSHRREKRRGRTVPCPRGSQRPALPSASGCGRAHGLLYAYANR